jgi:hypothetical protein
LSVGELVVVLHAGLLLLASGVCGATLATACMRAAVSVHVTLHGVEGVALVE